MIGEVFWNTAATGGNSNPYSNSKVNSPVKYPTNAAMINPGSNPSELIIFKTLDLLAKGKAVNYEGATGVEFTDVGEAFGSFLEKEIKGGKFKTKKQR